MVAQAWRFESCMISANVLRDRRSDFEVQNWIMDSGAFTEVTKHGGYRTPTAEYARQIDRWSVCGNLHAAVAQDYMCEPFALARTGLTIPDHQRLTINRYDSLLDEVCSGTTLLPVLQGYAPDDYARHIEQYGERLKCGQWVGVGSVCKRNAKPEQVEAVLSAILKERPDLKLHGFGLKITALTSPSVRTALHSADSMAWSFAARIDGRGPDANKWQEAMKYVERVEAVLNRPPALFRQARLWEAA